MSKPRVSDERLARLLDSGAIAVEMKLWRGTGVEHTTVGDVMLDLRDCRARLAALESGLPELACRGVLSGIYAAKDALGIQAPTRIEIPILAARVLAEWRAEHDALSERGTG